VIPSRTSLAFLASSALALVTLGLAPGDAVAAEEATASAATTLQLAVTPGEGGAPWTLRVTNTGELPVRLAADARLLVLEVTPPAGTAGGFISCALPADARPSTDEGQELVVPAKRSWSATIDPLFYCEGAKARAALVPGATVKARFGWPARGASLGRGAAANAKGAKPAKADDAGPFVVAPVGASVSKLAPASALEATPVTLTDAQRVSGAAMLTTAPGKTQEPAPAAAPDETPSRLVLTAAPALDVLRGVELPVTVTLTNEGERGVVLVFRPEMIRFRVAGPAGTIACGSAVERASPIRELFASLPPRGRASHTVLLAATCPEGTFDAPGLYRATAILDTTRASGRAIDVRSFDGVVTAKEPTLVRVRAARRASAAKRPALD
jgi:hypothetical protein